jgi:Predicted Zn peptidase
MIHLLEAHGVRVFSIIEDCHQMDAFSFWRGTAPHVFLNTMKSAEHSRLDGAHELGHLVLHWKGGVRGRDAEREAQMFGAAFLMPRGSVIAEAPRSGKLNQLVKAKRRWNVSVAALAYRMHELKLLTGWQYRSLFIEISRNGYRKSEPNPCQNETSQVLAKVFKALREDGLTMADVADALNIYPDELNKLIFGLVLTPVAGMQSSVA